MPNKLLKTQAGQLTRCTISLLLIHNLYYQGRRALEAASKEQHSRMAPAAGTAVGAEMSLQSPCLSVTTRSQMLTWKL